MAPCGFDKAGLCDSQQLQASVLMTHNLLISNNQVGFAGPLTRNLPPAPNTSSARVCLGAVLQLSSKKADSLHMLYKHLQIFTLHSSRDDLQLALMPLKG